MSASISSGEPGSRASGGVSLARLLPGLFLALASAAVFFFNVFLPEVFNEPAAIMGGLMFVFGISLCLTAGLSQKHAVSFFQHVMLVLAFLVLLAVLFAVGQGLSISTRP